MPVLRKRVLVAPVAKLPLNGPKAIHNFKIIAGARWTIEPPKDGGIGNDEPKDQHGYVKISSENFPEPNQNLKWANDVLDRMIHEANVRLFTFAAQHPGFQRISRISYLFLRHQTLPTFLLIPATLKGGYVTSEEVATRSWVSEGESLWRTFRKNGFQDQVVTISTHRR